MSFSLMMVVFRWRVISIVRVAIRLKFYGIASRIGSGLDFCSFVGLILFILVLEESSKISDRFGRVRFCLLIGAFSLLTITSVMLVFLVSSKLLRVSSIRFFSCFGVLVF